MELREGKPESEYIVLKEFIFNKREVEKKFRKD